MAEYVITDGTRFILKDRRGKFVPTSCEALTDVFSKKQAENIYQYQLPKVVRKVFRVEKYDIPPENVKQVTQNDLTNTEKVMVSDNIQKWLDKVSDLNGLATDASNRKEELLKQLSEVDQELSDCLHYIEFCNLNAAQGYKAYKMVRERRIERRSIKNELSVLDIILNKKISEKATDEIQTCVAQLDNRQYRPRVLSELFNL